MNGLEVETKLAVAGEHAARVLGNLRVRDSIGGCALGPAREIHIHDVYLDTPEGAMRAWGGAMRIRREDDRVLLTVKGPARRSAGKATSRPELELAFSAEGVDEALAWAQGLEGGAGLPRGGRVTLEPASIEGFEAIHDRRTVRVAREVTGEGGRAELALDRATYLVGGSEATLVEIEVEALDAGGEAILEACGRGLTEAFGEALVGWEMSKLAVGMVLRRLADAGRLEEVLGEGGVITGAGLRVIEGMGRVG